MYSYLVWFPNPLSSQIGTLSSSYPTLIYVQWSSELDTEALNENKNKADAIVVIINVWPLLVTGGLIKRAKLQSMSGRRLLELDMRPSVGS